MNYGSRVTAAVQKLFVLGRKTACYLVVLSCGCAATNFLNACRQKQVVYINHKRPLYIVRNLFSSISEVLTGCELCASAFRQNPSSPSCKKPRKCGTFQCTARGNPGNDQHADWKQNQNCPLARLSASRPQ